MASRMFQACPDMLGQRHLSKAFAKAVPFLPSRLLRSVVTGLIMDMKQFTLSQALRCPAGVRHGVITITFKLKKTR